MLWICSNRSDCTRSSSRSFKFNHFSVNLKPTGKKYRIKQETLVTSLTYYSSWSHIEAVIKSVLTFVASWKSFCSKRFSTNEIPSLSLPLCSFDFSSLMPGKNSSFSAGPCKQNNNSYSKVENKLRYWLECIKSLLVNRLCFCQLNWQKQS